MKMTRAATCLAAALLVACATIATAQNNAASTRARQFLPPRIAQLLQDDKSLTLISVLDENLDLAARLARESRTVSALVPLAPPIVVGQGDDPTNQTLVRVLNRYGIAESSFLAFPPSVRGGVWVAAGRDARGRSVIAAASIAANNVDEIHLFNRLGGQIGSLRPRMILPASFALSVPYVIACGDFLPKLRGDELAVMSRRQDNRGAGILIFDLQGALRSSIALPERGDDIVSLCALPDKNGARLAVYFQRHKVLLEVAPHNKKVTRRALPFLDANSAIYPTAFPTKDARVLATGAQPLLSTILRIGANGAQQVDVGFLENQFWINARAHGVQEEGRYVKNMSYAHIRTDVASPAYAHPALAQSDNPRDAQQMIEAGRAMKQLQKPLSASTRKLWEPTFTHRMPFNAFAEWAKINDENGLPKYLSLTRHNKPVTYGEFGKTADFSASTYALDVPALDRLYDLPLRGFLQGLAVRQRENPELLISVEPNHEHEIAIEKDETIGDYNPAMIAGFGEYSRRMLGLDEAGVKAHYGLPQSQKFDAPRDDKRGAWDAYDEKNPFFLDWTFYNRYVVNRRLADTFTQALLAGFPPELVKSHQIPDIFAIASTKGFSNVRSRITPVDYAMSAGVGFGYTRYGVWFGQKAQIQKATQTSGFDSAVLGEYQSLTPDQNAATQQLNYLFENGANGVHSMVWPADFDKGFNATMAQAIRDLIQHDRPRPGVTGGVGQVVPFSDGKRAFDIASIGVGPQHTGLLKSLKADGTFEGSVYAVPFRTAVKIENVPSRWQMLPSGARRLSVGPLNDLEGGQQIEITLRVLASAPRTLNFAVRSGGANGNELPGLSCAIPLQKGARNVRLMTRSQLPANDLFITLDLPRGVGNGAVLALRENERIAQLHRGVMEGVRHRGGVTFDVLK